jgi:predicted RecB family nuclease
MAATKSQPRARRRRRSLSWVSKSDLTSYLRCPYAFWLIDSGALAPEEAIDALGERLIEEGVSFERSITTEAQPPPPELDLATAFLTDIRIFGLPLLRNETMGFHGVPDAVDAAAGALIPVEIKSHGEVRRTDELELVFYWKLLEPYRTADPGAPRGRLILRRDGTRFEVEVRLTPERFAELDAVIGQVRDARRHGVRPRVCGCTVCSGPLREHIAKQTWAGRDLTLLWGIARRTAIHLEALGITDFDELARRDPARVAAALCARRVSVSSAQIEAWIEHARSYREGRGVMFGPPPPIDGSFIALDLEYDSSVWLTAVLICDGDTLEHNYFWADTPGQEREALMALEAIFATYPGLPIVTWAGCSADLPQLRYAAQRHRLDHVYNEVNARHLDLFQYARATMRIPDPELSLKAVADYFSIPRISDIPDGLHAQFLYADYLACREPKERARLHAELVAYNRDDLEATAAMVRIMRDGPDLWPAARANHWEEHRAHRPMPSSRMRPRVRLAPRRLIDPQHRRPSREAHEPTPSSPANPLNLPF